MSSARPEDPYAWIWESLGYKSLDEAYAVLAEKFSSELRQSPAPLLDTYAFLDNDPMLLRGSVKPNCTCEECAAIRLSDPVLDPAGEFNHRTMQLITAMRGFLIMWFPDEFASATPSLNEMWGVMSSQACLYDWTQQVAEAAEPDDKEKSVLNLFVIVRRERLKFFRRVREKSVAWARKSSNQATPGPNSSPDKQDDITEDAKKDEKDEDAAIDQVGEGVQNLKV